MPEQRPAGWSDAVDPAEEGRACQAALEYFRAAGVGVHPWLAASSLLGMMPQLVLMPLVGPSIVVSATAAGGRRHAVLEAAVLAAEWHFLSGRGNGAVLAYPPAE